MTSWIAEDDWSKVAIGDQVRATCEGQMLTGEVVDTLPGAIKRAAVIHMQTGAFHHSPRVVEGIWQLFVPAKPAVVLPTEPGVYASHNDPPSPVIIHKIKHGDWVDAGDENYLEDEEVMALMPLTLLEPVTVTAKKVIDFCESDKSCNTYRSARHEFGVTE
jgi:hypothetical protein